MANAEAVFGSLPASWVEYVTRFGALSSSGGTRWLLGVPASGTGYGAEADAVRAALLLRALYRKFPKHLIPIEMLPDRQVACVDAIDKRAPVVLLDLGNIGEGTVPWSPTLVDFVYEWRSDLWAINAALRHLQQRRQQVADGKRAKDKLDRPGDWTVTRMCSEDVVLAVLRTRHNREHNRHDISIFATATLTSFAPGATVRAALTSVLSEAYRSGGPLSAGFGAAGDGPIPASLRRWASHRGVDLPPRGGWDAKSGEKLYALAANLTDGTRQMLPLPGVPTGAVCFAVASGMWPPVSLEALLRWSDNPARILTGALSVTDRLSWIADRQVMRTALTVGTMRRVLARAGQRSASDDDDTKLDVNVTFGDYVGQAVYADPSVGAVTFSVPSHSQLQLNWPVLAGEAPQGTSLTAHILAVDNDLLVAHLPVLIRGLPPGQVIIVPADARISTDPKLGFAFNAAAREGVTVLASPDYTSTLDITGENAVLRARTART